MASGMHTDCRAYL
jgi:anaphase-promoting complex subunit 2